MAEELELEEETDRDRVVLRVGGTLDLATVPDLCLRLRRLRANGARQTVIDLSDLDFCDSTGLRALFGEAREAQIAGARLGVVAPRDGVARRLFDLTGAAQVLEVHPDRDSALLALAVARA